VSRNNTGGCLKGKSRQTGRARRPVGAACGLETPAAKEIETYGFALIETA